MLAGIKAPFVFFSVLYWHTERSGTSLPTNEDFCQFKGLIDVVFGGFSGCAASQEFCVYVALVVTREASLDPLVGMTSPPRVYDFGDGCTECFGMFWKHSTD